MAEVVGLAASIIAVLGLSAEVVKKCRTIIETAKDAPRDLRNVLIEVSSLTSALENLEFLTNIDCEFTREVSAQSGVTCAVQGCRITLIDLSKEIDSLSVPEAQEHGVKLREKMKTAIGWTWRESSVKKLLHDLLRYKTTITLGLLVHTT
jgi:hypothetical protein